ncbi:hypothetical protein L1987_75776 [Smallanthus sonchifolius]|uniref:Uncharacterized protein n=1 Tax=Smallanthus sonchifolius TaxID=185202 RepID=A0ACB9A6R4_9ASTR|nr:hypothetical protein L1987_75776 [Smallanthus sonchifolius]
MDDREVIFHRSFDLGFWNMKLSSSLENVIMKGNHSDLALRPYLLNSIGENGASRSREVEEEGRRPEGTDASVKERHLEAMGICYWWRLTGDVGRKEPFQSTDALVTGPEIRVTIR